MAGCAVSKPPRFSLRRSLVFVSLVTGRGLARHLNASVCTLETAVNSPEKQPLFAYTQGKERVEKGSC